LERKNSRTIYHFTIKIKQMISQASVNSVVSVFWLRRVDE